MAHRTTCFEAGHSDVHAPLNFALDLPICPFSVAQKMLGCSCRAAGQPSAGNEGTQNSLCLALGSIRSLSSRMHPRNTKVDRCSRYQRQYAICSTAPYQHAILNKNHQRYVSGSWITVTLVVLAVLTKLKGLSD